MGKTTICYAIVSILKGKKLPHRTLVICPIKPMYNVWPQQKDAWDEFKHLKVNVCHGKDRVSKLKDLSADICVINPEGLEWLEDHADYVRQNFDILIVDESTKFKNTSTKRFKRIRQFVKFFKRRYILTGSFTPQGLLDLFGQIYILDEGAALGRYITHYRTRYFYATDYLGFNLAPHAWAPGEIASKIAPLTLVLEREGNLDMPELMPPNDILVELPEEARVRYRAMEEDLLAQVESGFVVAANAAVATGKCRQIANGFIYHSDGSGEYDELHSIKVEAVEDLVDQLSGEPLLVCYEFKPDLDALKKKFPNALVLTTGNAAKDNAAINQFRTGSHPVALGQVKSISLGIDGLQDACANICMYALTWDLEAYSQSIDRIWRQGQPNPRVSLHRIIAKDTVDERVIQVLGNKDATQTSFLKLLREMRNAND